MKRPQLRVDDDDRVPPVARDAVALLLAEQGKDPKKPPASSERLWVWWRGRRYEGTWAELFPIIRRDLDICTHCRVEFLTLEKDDRGRLVCVRCRAPNQPPPF